MELAELTYAKREYYYASPTMEALEKIGRAFEGQAARLGLQNEGDVVALIKEFRKTPIKQGVAV